MKTFVYGSARLFEDLEAQLSDGMCHVYGHSKLPESCSPRTVRLGFDKVNGIYSMYIDKGVHTTEEDPFFRQFLDAGEAHFACMDDMTEFLYSLQPIFKDNPGAQPGQVPEGEDGVSDIANHDVDADHENVSQERENENPEDPEFVPVPHDEVVDKKKLRDKISEKKKKQPLWPEQISEPLKSKVYGQDEAIDNIAKLVAISHLRKEKRLLTIGFFGPTATGKSETAKNLADVISKAEGEAWGFIEVAASEFVGEHSANRFFGSPPGYVGYGQPTIFEAVRSNPKQVIVMNEIEKANLTVLTGLMEAIDTGFLGMADNSLAIDLNQCILIFTSNIPIDMDEYGKASEFEKDEICRDAFTKHCGRPEISGKIGNFVVFKELDDEAYTDVIIKFIADELKDYNLRLTKVDVDLISEFLKVKTKYGARGVRVMISKALGRKLLGERCLEGIEGRDVALSGTIDNIKFDIAG